MPRWLQINLDEDPDEVHYAGDPAELVDALIGLLDAIERRPAFHRQALCHGRTDLFFPERGASTDDAKRLCARCPVRAPCQATAVEDVSLHGVWGGLSPQERRTVRRGAA